MEAKFKHLDKVRVIKYGTLLWEPKNLAPGEVPLNFPIYAENSTFLVKDWSPDLVGQEGVVDQVVLTQGRYSYSVNGIPKKYAWYSEEQLELVNAVKITY